VNAASAPIRRITAPDDSLGKTASFCGFGSAQLLQLTYVNTEVRGESQDNLKNVRQFLPSMGVVVCCSQLADLLGQLRPQQLPVLPAVSDPKDRVTTLGTDELRDLVSNQLALTGHGSSFTPAAARPARQP
jgi:hypothetical protein